MFKVNKILVPVDFSENSKKILQHAVGIAEGSDAKLIFLYVVESLKSYGRLSIPHVSFGELEKGLAESAEREMEDFLEDNLDRPLAHESKVLQGNIVDKINSVAESEGVDMIVMGTHGYKGLEKAMFGSVAERVVKTAPCPVLTINPYK